MVYIKQRPRRRSWGGGELRKVHIHWPIRFRSTIPVPLHILDSAIFLHRENRVKGQILQVHASRNVFFNSNGGIQLEVALNSELTVLCHYLDYLYLLANDLINSKESGHTCYPGQYICDT